MRHPAHDLDKTVHQPARLGLLALLRDEARVTFTELRDALAINDGTLSRHLAVLEEAGYVSTEKGYEGKRPRTWVSLTDPGRDALATQVQTLRRLMSRLERRTGPGAEGALAALSAMFASAPTDEATGEHVVLPQPKPPKLGLGKVVLTSAPRGFVLIVDGPVNRYYELPQYPGVNYSFQFFFGGYEAFQQGLMSLGLRSGYMRHWSRTSDSSLSHSVVIQLLEFEDAEMLASRLKAFPGATGDAALPLDEVPDAGGMLIQPPEGGHHATAWFSVGTLVAFVVVHTDKRAQTVRLARSTAKRQFERMASLEPGEPSP